MNKIISRSDIAVSIDSETEFKSQNTQVYLIQRLSKTRSMVHMDSPLMNPYGMENSRTNELDQD